MATGQDLKQIVMLTYFTDAMLDSLARIVDVLKFDRDELIFREKEPSERFYMLKSGLVLLEQRISDHVTAYVSSVKPGYSFGWSAMLENAAYEFDAVCKEPCETYSFKADRIQKLFQEDPEMGLRMHRRLLVIIKNRLDIRTEQFKKAIKHHPDMQALFKTG
jgi:CRP-like cAMP-binding protein